MPPSCFATVNPEQLNVCILVVLFAMQDVLYNGMTTQDAWQPDDIHYGQDKSQLKHQHGSPAHLPQS